MRDKVKAITEAARVLKPGGLLILTFDICEPDMGMTFPEWNGRALTMQEFDDIFMKSGWFETGTSEQSWNTADIPEYLSWNRTTAPHHNYITGAALFRRNRAIWPIRKGSLIALRRRGYTRSAVAGWYLRWFLRAFILPCRWILRLWQGRTD
jgi:hypothetical protein